MLTRITRNRSCRRSRGLVRRGAAVVEMAVVAPLLLTLLFGVMEFGWMFMVSETVTNAARECARLATFSTPDSEVQARFVSAMSSTNVNATADMVNIQRTGEGDSQVVTVTITVPYSQVTITGLISFLGVTTQNLTSSCSMRVEGTF